VVLCKDAARARVSGGGRITRSDRVIRETGCGDCGGLELHQVWYDERAERARVHRLRRGTTPHFLGVDGCPCHPHDPGSHQLALRRMRDHERRDGERLHSVWICPSSGARVHARGRDGR